MCVHLCTTLLSLHPRGLCQIKRFRQACGMLYRLGLCMKERRGSPQLEISPICVDTERHAVSNLCYLPPSPLLLVIGLQRTDNSTGSGATAYTKCNMQLVPSRNCEDALVTQKQDTSRSLGRRADRAKSCTAQCIEYTGIRPIFGIFTD